MKITLAMETANKNPQDIQGKSTDNGRVKKNEHEELVEYYQCKRKQQAATEFKIEQCHKSKHI